MAENGLVVTLGRIIRNDILDLETRHQPLGFFVSADLGEMPSLIFFQSCIVSYL